MPRPSFDLAGVLILVSCLILVPRLDVPNWKRERIYLTTM
jgi:hypothetical protein